MEIRDYEILVQKLNPPMKPNRNYYAKIQFLKVVTDNGLRDIDPGLGEVYGETSSEARSKMQELFDEWVLNNEN